MDKWSCYIIENRGYTYVGVSNNVHKRLRAHNKEISGGAKYTTSKGKGMPVVLKVELKNCIS